MRKQKGGRWSTKEKMWYGASRRTDTLLSIGITAAVLWWAWRSVRAASGMATPHDVLVPTQSGPVPLDEYAASQTGLAR